MRSVDLRLLGIFLLSLVLSGGVFFLVRIKPEGPERPHLVVAESLMSALRDAEMVRTTEKMNLGSNRGQRHTVEADPILGSEAGGVLSRSDEETPFAWVVGPALDISLDLVELTDRELTLVVAAATDAPQSVELFWNGEALGTTRLRTDDKPMHVRAELPAGLQRIGRNRLRAVFAETLEQTVDGVARPLPMAARAYFVRLEPVDPGEGGPGVGAQPIARLASSTDGDVTEESVTTRLEQPAGTCVLVATRLPPTARVALRIELERLDIPVIWSVLTELGERDLLIELTPGLDGLGPLTHDLTPWSGQIVRLESRVSSAAEGEVHQKGLVILAPEDEVQALVPAPVGELDVRQVDGRSVVAWTLGGDRLVVDVSRRLVTLHAIADDPGETVDLSREREASTALMLQQLARHLLESEGEHSNWAERIRALRRRQ